MQMEVTLPTHLEAVFAAPDGTLMGTYRNGDLVDTDWKMMHVRVRRSISHPYMRVPWGELFFMLAASSIIYKRFGWSGVLLGGFVIWTAQRIMNHVADEIEERQRLAQQMEREAWRARALSESADES
jgi:hypothetical protein